MKEGFIKLDGQDKPQKMFYEPKQTANNKTLADMQKIQQCSHEWLGDVSVFASSLLFQGGILSFENAQAFLKYFQKTVARINDQISSNNSKAYLKAKKHYWENRMYYLWCYSFDTEATNTV